MAEFYKMVRQPDGRRPDCKTCHLKVKVAGYPKRRQWRKNQKEKFPSKVARQYKKWSLKTLYGLSIEQHDEMMLKQNGCCACCNRPFSGQINTDHDHVSGKIRELLCSNCNFILGHAHEDETILFAVAAYIRKHKESDGPKCASR